MAHSNGDDGAVGATGIALTMIVVVAALAAYTLGTAGRGEADDRDGSAEAARTIVMAGQGTATGVPDELRFTLGVSVKRDDVATAMDVATRTMKQTLASLKAFGVAGKDVQTTGLSINPVYDYSGNTERLTGYSVNQRARVTVPQLSKAGAAMSAAAAAGGDAVRIQSVSLAISDRSKLLAQARRAAVADATAKAREYAAASGQHLGAVTSLKELGAPARVVPQAAAFDASAAKAPGTAPVPIRAGKQDLDVRIQVVWSLA